MLSNTNLIEDCTKELANGKRKLCTLTNVTFFLFYGKKCNEVPGRSTARATYKKHIVDYLTCEKTTRKPDSDKVCLLRALALHLHGNEKLEEETPKVITLFPEKFGGTNETSFQGVFGMVF